MQEGERSAGNYAVKRLALLGILKYTRTVRDATDNTRPPLNLAR